MSILLFFFKKYKNIYQDVMDKFKNEKFLEIQKELDAVVSLWPDVVACYTLLYQVLDRACRENVSGVVGYSTLFSCLYAVCRQKGIEYTQIDSVRRRIRLVMQRNRQDVNFKDLEYDRLAVNEFVCKIYEITKDENVEYVYCKDGNRVHNQASDIIKVRAVVTSVGCDTFCCHLDMDGSAKDELVGGLACLDVIPLLKEGMMVNLIDVKVEESMLVPRLVILEPDYLIDVSSLAACYRPYGCHPCNYLVSQLSPYANSASILLGNAANQFMEDSVVSCNTTFENSIRKHFRSALLNYTCCRESIDVKYFNKAREQYDNIAEYTEKLFESPDFPDMQKGKMLLESSFVCEALGLRGRFDVMSKNHRMIIELKSGRADDFGCEPRPKKEHVLQMALYKEILHYNMGIPRDEIVTLLFYSSYPKIFDERSSAEAVYDVMMLRNRIIAFNYQIISGDVKTALSSLRLEVLNQKCLNNKFYELYLKPQLQEIINPILLLQDIERSYFETFLCFIFREMYYSKVGDGKADSNRGAATLWTQEANLKIVSGDMLPNLVLLDVLGGRFVEELVFSFSEDVVANFSVGEMVLFYEYGCVQDNVTNKQVYRAYIKDLTNNCLSLQLENARYGLDFFEKDKKYAVEHDATDVVFTQQIKGLFAFCLAPKERRDLLLCRRAAKININKKLLGDYGPALNDIVLGVKKAEDFYLLMGPPGTGKTSRALKAIVCEFLFDRNLHREDNQRIMLLAYTNRAVDEICAMLQELQKENKACEFVRFGKVQTCHPDFHSCLLEEKTQKCANRKDVMDLLMQIPIFVGTVTTMSAYRDLYSKLDFSMVVIDEASQLIESQIIGLLSAKNENGCAFRKIVMIGDHKQLPAVVVQSSKDTEIKDVKLREIGFKNARVSLFERLWEHQHHYSGGECTAMLHRQGRMHAELCAFVSKAFYSNLLDVVPLPHQMENLEMSDEMQSASERFVSTTRLGFVDVRKEQEMGNVKVNVEEARVVAEIIEALQVVYEKRGDVLCFEKQVGVIVPFRGQIAVIKKILRERFIHGDKIMVDTVECYQGSQRDIIIYSTTISKKYQLELLSVSQDVDGVEVDRKLNVAISRARKQLFVLGNASLLSENHIYGQLIKNSKFVRADSWSR